MDPAAVVERVVTLPVLLASSPHKSPLMLIAESGLADAPSALTHAVVREFLEPRPALVAQWQRWSENKRTSEGWYLLSGHPSVVGYYPNGERFEFDALLDACTEFVMREAFHLLQHAR